MHLCAACSGSSDCHKQVTGKTSDLADIHKLDRNLLAGCRFRSSTAEVHTWRKSTVCILIVGSFVPEVLAVLLQFVEAQFRALLLSCGCICRMVAVCSSMALHLLITRHTTLMNPVC